jgi:hypothetical protein
MVEGGPVPRAKVMDQAMIDRYLMLGELTLAQHQAGEYLLGQAAKSGIYARAPNPDTVQGGQKNFIPMGVFAFGRTLDLLTKRFGEENSRLVAQVVCHDLDVSGDEESMELLQDSLQLISDRRMSGGRSPARHIKKCGG